LLPYFFRVEKGDNARYGDMNMRHKTLFSLSTLLVILSCLALYGSSSYAQSGFSLTSTAFTAGNTIPVANSCSGNNDSPALSWSGAPAGTKSFVLILSDPDAPHGTFIHWVAFDIPGSATTLAAGVPHVDEIPGGGQQGMNSAAKIGYIGPCPPPGKVHHYHFTLYALNSTINLPKGASLTAVKSAMEVHVIGKTELVGTFSR
jgi:Raf kinase inhibitor-like YbhB/YbcL family protein